MALIDGFRQYVRDNEVDDSELQMYLDAAKSYLTDAGVPPQAPDQDNAKYNLALFIAASHWFDMRGVQVIGATVSGISKSLDALVLQLRNGVDE